MKDSTRVGLELLGLPLLAGLLFFGFIAVLMPEGQRGGDSLLGIFLLCVVFAPLVGIFPSVFYMVIMEFAFKRGLNPRSIKMVALSGALGFGAGTLLGWPIIISSEEDLTGGRFLYSFIGLFAGLILGCIIRWGSSKSANVP